MQECQEWLTWFEIDKLEKYSKLQFKRIIKKKIHEENKNDILNQLKSYKKLNWEEYKEEEFRVQPYFNTLNIPDTRTRFKLKSFMTPTVQMNFLSDPSYAKKLWTCSGCSRGGDAGGCPDTQRHIIACTGYAKLRKRADLNKDKDLVRNFQQIIQIRKQNA